MTAEPRIFAKYQSVGVRRGMECLLRHADALRFLDDCERSQLMVLGMDFYKQEGSDIVELLNSADYSSLSGREDAVVQSIGAARRLIQTRLPDEANWVSFVVEEHKANGG